MTLLTEKDEHIGVGMNILIHKFVRCLPRVIHTNHRLNYSCFGYLGGRYKGLGVAGRQIGFENFDVLGIFNVANETVFVFNLVHGVWGNLYAAGRYLGPYQS